VPVSLEANGPGGWQAVCEAVDAKVEEMGAGTEARLERLAQSILGEVEPKLATVGESMRDVQETLLGAMEAAAADAKLAEEALRTEILAEVEASAADTQQALVRHTDPPPIFPGAPHGVGHAGEVAPSGPGST
jgi:hypothetical protein